MVFTTKKEVGLEDFCRDFYKNILDGTLHGVNVNETYYKGFKDFIVEVFPDFSSIDPNKLKEEFTVLRFELFALAWQDSFDEDLSVAQNVFTMRFLEEKNKKDIWDRMGRYNGAVASGIRKATCMNQRDSEILDSDRFGVKQRYAELAIKYGVNLEEQKGLDVIIRMGSRIKSNKAWKDGQGMIAYYLSLTLLRILGYTDAELEKITDNQNISVRLMTIMKGFYNGAKESWEDVKIINYNIQYILNPNEIRKNIQVNLLSRINTVNGYYKKLGIQDKLESVYYDNLYALDSFRKKADLADELISKYQLEGNDLSTEIAFEELRANIDLIFKPKSIFSFFG